MTFTIEQLEALKEGIAPGRWGAVADYPYVSIVEAAGEDGESTAIADIVSVKTEITPDHDLMAASPALVDALIAEKQAHAELRKRIEERIRELKQPLCSHMPEGDELDDYLEQWDRQSYEAAVLTQILEGNE